VEPVIKVDATPMSDPIRSSKEIDRIKELRKELAAMEAANEAAAKEAALEARTPRGRSGTVDSLGFASLST